MVKFLKSFFKFYIFLGTILGPFVVLALTVDDSLEGSTISIDTPKNLFTSLVNWFAVIAGVMAVAGVIYAGIMFATAAGDAEKTKTAKSMLLWSVIGGVVIILAYGILMFATNFISTGNLPAPDFSQTNPAE